MVDPPQGGKPGGRAVEGQGDTDENDQPKRTGQGSGEEHAQPGQGRDKVTDTPIKRIWRAIARCSKAASHPIANLTSIAALVIAIVALNDTRSTLRLTERAWIVPGTIKLTAPLETGKYNEVVFAYRNPGKQPATEVTYKLRPLALPRSDIHKTAAIQAEILKAMDNKKCRVLAPSGEKGKIIFPSDGAASRIRIAIPQELAQKVRDKMNYLLIAGCFAYKTFGETHHSAFCSFFDFGVNKPNATSMDWSPSKCFIPDYAD